jgi:hemerythrin
MAEIKLKTSNPDQAAELLAEALETEKMRLVYSLDLAKRRLEIFEKKYGVRTQQFLSDWVAEDLDGKDMEYVEWAGESKLAALLSGRIETLTGIEHVPSA